MSAGALRRLLALVCSPRTMARIVDPVLADIAVERSRSRVKGYGDLLRALAVHAWAPAAPSTGLLVLVSGAVAVSTALLFNSVVLINQFGRGTLAAAHVFQLLPGTLLLTVPAALLVAVPVALRRQAITGHIVRRHLLLGAGYMAFAFVLVAWIFPEANQAYRVSTSGNPLLQRGTNELSLTRLRSEFKRLRQFQGGERRARTLEYAYDQRFALTVTPIATMLLGLALARTRSGRRWPIAAGVSAMALYFAALMPATSLAAGLLIHSSQVPPWLLAWIPNAAVLTFALLLQRSAIDTPPIPWTTLPPPGSSNDRIS